MRVTRSKSRGEDGHQDGWLVFVALVAIFLIGFLSTLAQARAHGHAAFASIALGLLGGLLGLAFLVGVSYCFLRLAKWSEARERRRELEKERRN